MKKMKLYVPLFVTLFLGMAGSAFAQLSCDVASTPVSRAISSGHAEQAGDLIFNCTHGGTATTAATITVGYGVTITNNVTIPGGAGSIAIASTTGTFAAAPPTVTNASISNATGQIVISVPAQPATAAGTPASFTLTGVRVSLSGTGLGSLTANVSVSPGSGVLITAGQNVATVITTILAGIEDSPAPALTGLSALYFSSSATAVPGRGAFTFTVTENFIDAFRDASQITGASNDTNLLVTFSGMPTGTTITGCTATITAAFTTLTVSGGGVATAAAPTLTITFDGPTNTTAIETVTVTCTGFTAPAAALPLSATITATVTLAPVSTALTGAGAVIPAATHFIPRFAAVTHALGTVLSFTPNTTTMILPYVVATPGADAGTGAGVFDTGVAIANTSSDVVGAGSIFTTGGAVAQAGTITFHFFPSSGTAADRFSVTTASVAAGATFISNVSDLMESVGRTTAFSGYVIAVANFTNAHGAAFVYGGSSGFRITSATDVLVVPSPIASARTATGGLGFLVEATSK
jgi:hypothetical protein